MALPTLVKTWQTDVNNLSPGDVEATHSRELMWQLKNILTGFGTLPWAVNYSCGGSTLVAGTVDDGVDRWTAYTDLAWSTGDHSWIVFDLPGGQQILFDQGFSVAVTESQYVFVSPGGNFTGGSVSTRPTASDETQICVDTTNVLGNNWAGSVTSGSYTSVDARIHAWHSTDGTHTRVLLYRNDVCCCMWDFGFLADKRTAQTSSFYAGIISGGTAVISVIDSTKLMDTGWRFTWPASGDAVRLYTMTLGGGSAPWTEFAAASVAEEWDGEIHVTPFATWSNDRGARGFKGSLVDLWMSPYQVLAVGDTSPNSASVREFIHLKGYCFPWTGDATVILTA